MCQISVRQVSDRHKIDVEQVSNRCQIDRCQTGVRQVPRRDARCYTVRVRWVSDKRQIGVRQVWCRGGEMRYYTCQIGVRWVPRSTLISSFCNSSSPPSLSAVRLVLSKLKGTHGTRYMNDSCCLGMPVTRLHQWMHEDIDTAHPPLIKT